mmetsp:Transcript_22169/g.56324  ORF Transcript_22169/g.56324 Transcript_22169/m.56324 type:complete len:213 (+) Transcript_22169:445-1083(+)
MPIWAAHRSNKARHCQSSEAPASGAEKAGQWSVSGHTHVLYTPAPPSQSHAGALSPAYTLSTRQVRMDLSRLQLASVLPSGANATHVTSSVWPVSVRKHSCWLSRHSLTSLSSPPLATQSPSGDTAMQLTLELWPVNVCSVVPASTSHSRIVSSHDPETSLLESGSHATEGTCEVWPLSSLMHAPVAKSHTRTLLSADPVAKNLPSGEAATQ